ncbi:hypothetical protein KI387_038550, partial [Taxus chinensis]
VEHIIREQNIMAAYEVIELFCELVVVRLPIIETQRECPLDLREAVSSLCFAAPRCSDLPELQQVQQMFAAKYGREFVMAASELRPDCGVNRQIIEKLSVRAPLAEVKLKLMKEIAEEHEVEWDSSNTEAEFFKLHEDLLDGPTHFVSGSKMPLPDEKDKSHFSVKQSSNGSDSDTVSDDLDLPEVPKQSVVQSSDAELARGTVPPVESSPTPSESETTFNRDGHDSVLHLSPLGSDVPVVNLESPVGSPTTPPSRSEDTFQLKQFVPFITSPPPTRSSEKLMTNTESVSRKRSETSMDFQDVLAAAQAAAESADQAAAAARAAADLAKFKISELSIRLGSGSFASDDKDLILADDRKKTFYSGKHATSDSSLPLDPQSEQISETGQRQTDIFDLNLEKSERRGEGELGLDASHPIYNHSSNIQAGSIPPPPGHPEQNIGLNPKTSGKPLYDSPSQIPSPIQPQSEQISETGQRQTDIFDLNLERSERRGEGELDLDAFHPIYNNNVQAGTIPPPPGHPERNTGISPKTSGKPFYDSPSQIPSPIHDTALDRQSTIQPQRWNSMEDDYYYTYPSIFDSQNSFSQHAESETLDNPTSDTSSTTHSDQHLSYH